MDSMAPRDQDGSIEQENSIAFLCFTEKERVIMIVLAYKTMKKSVEGF
ncbi:MAG: hypothetical protein PVS3B3_37250 [Ktedonobacteraceae bacterium]